ncbi:related to ALY2-alpha arrestin [Ustilago bromivora]|uniref:Related to ALY2 - alpha arrestin n=1 Tax=Ustilago bromivora TaxID=307758 RepID=A0A1K0HB51_9BASI|nr:related to ALY2-alpha arrestin [Ustilago bromivora]SYW77885.1 related to ALY2 - alpha arrestin [Ustilago bromivora]
MSPPASVTITQLEPVVFLRGQSSSGEDARGRRRPVNIDAPPSQLRALVTVYLPKPSKIKEINISLKGTAKTDWPEGIGPNRVENAEEMTIFDQAIGIYNAKYDKAVAAVTRRRSNSVGPGIGLRQDVDWDYAAANANATANANSDARPSSSNAGSRQASGSNSGRKDDDRRKSSGKDSGSGGGNLARQIAGAAAKAGTAMIPPTLRPDMGLSKPKDNTTTTTSSSSSSSSSRNRPPLQQTGSGTTSFSQYATSPDSTSATSPPATFNNPRSRAASSAGSTSLGTTPATSLFDERWPPAPTHQDMSTWHEYFESRGYERPPLYAPRSAPCEGYDSWPTEVPAEASSARTDATSSGDQPASSSVNSASFSAAPSASATPMDRTAANSTDVMGSVLAIRMNCAALPTAGPSSSSAVAPARSILHTQLATTSRPKEHTVRFDPQWRVDNAASSSSSSNNNGFLPKPNSNKSASSSRRGSVELQDKDRGSKGKSSSKPNTNKKPGLKTLINGLLKEPITTATTDNKVHPNDAVASATDSKEFKKGTYTYPICISLPSNLPPTLHADFGFNRYVLRANVVRAGPLTPNLTAQREVTLIHAPDEDALEETDSIVVERCWEDLLSYMVVFSGKSFPIGQKIPLWLKFMPLGKVKIYRIIATLEERTDYFAKGRRVARHEVPRKWTLMKIGHASATEPILPILSDSADALDKSPLAPLARAAAGEDEDSNVLPSILDPTGPWELATELSIPACSTTRINLSTNHSKSNIAVHHLIRLSIRVGRSSQGDWEVWNDNVGCSSSSTAAEAGKRKTPQLYDIIIEAPITLTHSHTAVDWTALPNYSSLPAEPADADPSGSVEIEAPLRPALPSPVMISRTGMVGQTPLAVGGASIPSPLRSPTGTNGGGCNPASSSPPTSRNPTQLSRRWLALSADSSSNPQMNSGGAAPPPPAYQASARTGETTVASTSISQSPSETNPNPLNGNTVGNSCNLGMAH